MSLKIFFSYPFNVHSLEAEYKKISAVRFIVGLLMSARFFQVSQTFYILEGFSANYFLSIFQLIFSISLCVGIFTSFSSLVLILSSSIISHYLNIWNLSDFMTILFLSLFVFANSSHYFSIDRIFKKYFNVNFSSPLNIVENERDLQKLLLLIFIIYGLASLGGIMYHLNDTNWQDGKIVIELLTNSYLSNGYQFFADFLINNESLFAVISALGTIFQSCFQIFMIPAIFIKRLRPFVFFYGLFFFLISLFIIKLSFLPYFEILLWLVLFREIPKYKIEIIYDDYCNLCRNTIKFFKLLDFNNILDYLPLSKNKKISNNKSLKNISEHITGIYNNKFYQGYDLYLILTRKLKILWIFYPIFIIGKMLKIGPYVYIFIAKRRAQIFGLCPISSEDEIKYSFSPIIYEVSWFKKYFFKLYAVMVFLFFFKLPTPFYIDKLDVAYEYLGLAVPNVFNSEDLGMGNAWILIYNSSIDEDQLINFINKDGSRGSYRNNYFFLDNHYSDRLYFGNTLRSRRYINTKSIENIDQFLIEKINERIIFDYNFHNYKFPQEYKAYLMKKNLSTPIDSITHKYPKK